MNGDASSGDRRALEQTSLSYNKRSHPSVMGSSGKWISSFDDLNNRH